MKGNFLESDFLSKGRIVIFGVNRVTSEPTVDHIKNIDKQYLEFQSQGIDGVYCVAFTDFAMAPFLLPKLSKNIEFVIDTDTTNLKWFQSLLGKKGNVNFLKQYWQFACVVNNGQVEHYVEQPFSLETKILADTREKIYSSVGPEIVLEYLHRSSIG